MEPIDFATVNFVPLDEQPISVDTHTADGVFIKWVTVATAGSIIPQHAHVWDHTSFVSAGAIAAWADGVWLGVYQAPAGLFIKAGVKHTFQTLADDTILLCIHNALHPEVAAVLAEYQLEF